MTPTFGARDAFGICAALRADGQIEAACAQADRAVDGAVRTSFRMG
jgi:hypothetical protein